MNVTVAELDFTQVTNNQSVQAQGVITCIYTANKGWFSPSLGRFVSRQDLAIITNIRGVEL